MALEGRVIQLEGLLKQAETYINRLEQTIVGVGMELPPRIVTKASPKPANGPGTGFVVGGGMIPMHEAESQVIEAPEPSGIETDSTGKIVELLSSLSDSVGRISKRLDLVEHAIGSEPAVPQQEPAKVQKPAAPKRKPPLKACGTCNQDILAMHIKRHSAKCTPEAHSEIGVYNA